jgi:hypothetical protein
MSLLQIHDNLGNAALFYFLALAVWGLLRFALRRGVSSGYWGALVIAELLTLAQGGLGAILFYGGARPERGIHVLYGVVSVLAIPLVYASTKGREERPEMLLYGVAALVTAGLILRAMTTAG